MSPLPSDDTGYQILSFKVLTGDQREMTLEYVQSPLPFLLGKMATVSELIDKTPHIVRVMNPTLFSVMTITANVHFPLKADYTKDGTDFAGLTSFLEYIKNYAGVTLSFTDELPHTALSQQVMITTSTYTISHATKEFDCGGNKGGLYRTSFQIMATI